MSISKADMNLIRAPWLDVKKPGTWWLEGDVRDVLAALPENSVDLVLTSPPFLALRSYLPADHPDKGKEIGSEATPGEFIDTLLDVTEACARVLSPHGSLCFELGDTFSGSGGAGGDYTEDGLRAAQPKFTGSGYARRVEATMERTGPGRTTKARAGWPTDKSLCLIPESYRWALAYGRNPFTGRQTDPWRVRNVVRWCKPNPPVGALGDKFRPATSEMVIACKSRTRWFDLDAVRGEYAPRHGGLEGVVDPRDRERAKVGLSSGNPGKENNPAGAPPLDWWEIPTEGYPGSHYATWPQALLVKPILSMCPERVCRECGEPSRRITERESLGVGFRKSGENLHDQPVSTLSPDVADVRTIGWTDCGHAYRPGVVLDPFGGSGTTLRVAHGNGRSGVGIDLDGRNYELARQRVGMWLETWNPFSAEVPA